MAQTAPASLDQARAAVCARLRARRTEIEQAALTRVYAVSDPSEAINPEYLEGLRMAVSAAIDYGLAAVERGEERSAPIPAVLLVQARLAARSGVSLDTVLRRYFAGYAVLGDFIAGEPNASDSLGVDGIHRIGRDQAALFDRLLAAVTEEYRRESTVRRDSAEARGAERVRRLLAGELLDTSELAYEFDAWHLGALAAGPGALEAIRDLAKGLDRRLLFISGGEGTIWAWLGGRQKLTAQEALAYGEDPGVGMVMAFGEPAQKLPGWRLTHRQAMSAMTVARRNEKRAVRYADVALVASMLQDDLLVTSLRELYLVPLAEERDGGAALWETLSAYLAAERNMSSAAAALGVSRRTIANRLRAIEVRLGRPLNLVMPNIEAALRLRELETAPVHYQGPGRTTS
jgi:PucR C-terminal helix-turn-helix domain